MGSCITFNCNCDLTKLADYLWRLHRHIESEFSLLKDNSDGLKYKKNQMVQEIANKERDGKHPTEILSGWIERVKNLEDDLKSILEPREKQKQKQNIHTGGESEESHEYSHIPPPTTCLGGLCYKNWLKADDYKNKVDCLSRRVQGLLDEHKDLIKEGILYEDKDPGELPLGEMIGMDEMFNAVLNCLRNEKGPRIIGIHGLGGIGKTTLLTRIYNHLKAKQTATKNFGFGLFDQVLWIDGLKGSDIQSVQLAIGERLGLTWAENASEGVRGAKIITALKTKKYLLLIDDVQKSLEFIHVGVPKNGTTRVIFTTNDATACSEANQTIPLERLSEEDAWDLFKNSDQMKSTLCGNEEIVPLAKEVAQLCGGLPLALVTIRSAMSCKKCVEDWNHAIEMLRTQEYEFIDIGKKVYDKLILSYDLLRITAQPCFLYCYLFPKGWFVEEEELIHYWYGENLIEGNNSALKDILGWGKHMITTLMDVHLLMSGETEGTITMHDIVRGSAKWIASDRGLIKNKFWVEYKATLIELPTHTNSIQVEKASLVECEIEGSLVLNCPNLSTLILKMSNLNNIHHDFFRPMEKIKVLDLSGCKIWVLHDNITSLTNLQYLNLSKTDISALPKNFKNLQNLKYLDLSYMNKLQIIPPDVISKLRRLKFLNMFHSGLTRNSKGILSETGEKLIGELDELKNLEDLGITIKSDDAFKSLQNSGKTIKCTQSLFISNCKEVESLQLLENLKVLRVLSCFKLHDGLTVKQDSLRRVDIEDCPELDGLDWLRDARNLRFLRVVGCMNIKQVIGECKCTVKDMTMKQVSSECETSAEAEKRTKRKQVNCECGKGESLFSKLTHLHLENLPMLKTICGHDLEICVLEQITVVECPQLKKLPLDVNSNSKRTLKFISGNQKWWNNLQMDKAAKTIFAPYFHKF